MESTSYWSCSFIMKQIPKGLGNKIIQASVLYTGIEQVPYRLNILGPTNIIRKLKPLK